MPKIQPFDPEAVALLESVAAASAARVARLLKWKAQKADELRDEAATTGDEKTFQRAERMDKEVLLIVELIQDYKQLIQQHKADNDSAWGMIELQDKRCDMLKARALAENKKAGDWYRAYLEANEQCLGLRIEATRLQFEIDNLKKTA